MADESQRKMEFSFRTRKENLKRLENEEFDFLIVGGGITGAGVAWDAASRGYKVALVEKDDFAQGTSSRSSKLIHGGLRYLENYEFALVFEALHERTYLLENSPHLVRPLPFFMPVYETSPHSSLLLSAGMWFYDILSTFRAPALHQKISKGTTARMIPGIKKEGLVCSFKYYDASMWDDALVIDVLAKAQQLGACVVSRTKAEKPIYDDQQKITGMTVSAEDVAGSGSKKINIRFKKLIVCAGVWTDEVGKALAPDQWKPWLAPSRGTHIVFAHDRFPIPGAVTMQIEDGRIAFAIPRPDFGPGVTIVGTTDGPSPQNPDHIEQDLNDIATDQAYLLELLSKYFPDLKLTAQDVINHYIGIRPLVRPDRGQDGEGAKNLQKVSREHTIDHGPGGSVVVAGGKYTTFRKMGEQIVDFATAGSPRIEPQTDDSIFPAALPASVLRAREVAKSKGWSVPEKLYDRYGADALEIYGIHLECCDSAVESPDGFPMLEAQFRYAVRKQMVTRVEDFVRRRQPLHLCRQDHGGPWISLLEKALADEMAK
jgi:glycerol-3-phosphate dehydrogenase